VCQFAGPFRLTTPKFLSGVGPEQNNVSVCNVPVLANVIQPAIVAKQLELKGFVSHQFRDRWMEGLNQNLRWVQQNKLKYRETITDGFENAPRALMGVLKGENIGKALVRVKASHVEHESVDFNNALSKFKKFQGHR
jgi:hypothetical protein